MNACNSIPLKFGPGHRRLAGLVLAALACCCLASPARGDPPDEVAITFKSTPPGAAVSVDGQEACSARCTRKLFRGSHVVGMSKDGYEAREEILELKRDQTLHWKLVAYDGTLALASEPPGLKVTITRKGSKKGKRARTPVSNLALRPGAYVVKLNEKKYEASPLEVHVAAGEGTVAEIEPMFIMATLSVTVVDEEEDTDGIKVTANGKRLKGKGPWTLKPGSWRVVVKQGRRKLLDQRIKLDKGSGVDLEVSVHTEYE